MVFKPHLLRDFSLLYAFRYLNFDVNVVCEKEFLSNDLFASDVVIFGRWLLTAQESEWLREICQEIT